MDLVLLFELFSTGKQNMHRAIKLILSIVTGQKSPNQIAQYMVQSWRSLCNLLWMLGTFRRPLSCIDYHNNDYVLLPTSVKLCVISDI